MPSFPAKAHADRERKSIEKIDDLVRAIKKSRGKVKSIVARVVFDGTDVKDVNATKNL